MSNTTHYLKDYRSADFHIDTTELCFELGETYTIVTNTMTIRRADHAIKDSALVLNGENQTLVSVTLDGAAYDNYSLTDTTLTLAEVPDTFTLTIVSQCQPQLNKTYNGLYQSNGMFCTQCESHGFRRITYYLDRPDVMSLFTTKIIANQTTHPILLSNGNKTDAGTLDNNQHYAVWQDPFKKPCYLFALVAGNLAVQTDEYLTCSGRKVALEIYTAPEDIDKVNHAMHSLKDAMRWDEDVYGREYDLDIYMIVAVADFNMGAMENKGLNIFNTKYVLADPSTATDRDFELVHTVIGHEYFHNWTGNRVTCRDWFQLSLKEGLTVFRDECFTADAYSATVKRIEDVNIIRSAQFAEDASPMAHPIRPASYEEMNNFYTVTVYNKGAEVIRMQHTLVSAEGFRQGTDLYFERHDGQAVTCDDFVAAIADANNIDMTQFKRWYSQAGTPVVTLTQTHYDAATEQYHMTFTQHCEATADGSPKAPFMIPIKVGLLDTTGQDMEVDYQNHAATEHVLQLIEPEQTFVFGHVTEPPTPSILRDFSAPVKLHTGFTLAQWLFLFAHDSNEFNRWDAGQTAAKSILHDAISAMQSGNSPVLPQGYIEAIKATLLSEDLDTAFIAEAISLPSLTSLAQDMNTIDVDALLATHQWFKTEIATALQAELKLIIQTHPGIGSQLDKVAADQRRLRNVCMHYLACVDIEALSMAQQDLKADSMTTQLAALSCLTNYAPAEQKSAAVELFYTNWQHDALVMDKWLATQATALVPDVLEQVTALTQSPIYDNHNPNKVYALIVSFTQNYMGFHRADGAGYRFIAEQIEHIDTYNPQVAARIARSLMNWQRFDAKRQTLMRAELERIHASSTLSPDVREIVAKSLG